MFIALNADLYEIEKMAIISEHYSNYGKEG